MGNAGSVIAGPSALESCLKSAIPSNLVAGPSKVDWLLTDVQPYNLAVGVKPVAVTYPQTNEHVSSIIVCANRYNVKVQAKSGGHSYANFAWGGGNDNTLVVDLKNMKSFTWNKDTWVATVGGGSLLGELTDKMKKDGNRAFAHGTCPQVGIGGHATIGGLGPASRQWGSALDHIVGATIVLANSSIVKTSATENPDLLWAIKGAGASYGVITEFNVRTHSPPSETVYYSYTFSGRPYSKYKQRFRDWQQLIANPSLSRKFASQVIFSELGMIIEGTYFGPRSEWNALNITNVFPDATTLQTLVFNDWAGLVSNWAEDLALKLTGGMRNAFYAKSLAFTNKDLIPDAGIDAFFDYLDRTDKGTPIWFAIFDLEGGAINDVAPDATAYAHRDALFYFQPYASSLLLPLSQKSRDFVAGITKVLADYVPGARTNGAYPGYVDLALGQNAQRQYWGANYPRLQELKRTFDPSDVFRNPQSVRLPDQ